MSKKKPWLLIYTIISFCVIIAAVIVSLTAGLNLGSDIAGGSQIEVIVTDNAKTENQLTNDAKAALSESGVTYEKIFIEDKYTDTYVVIRTNNKSIDKEKVIDSLSVKMGVKKSAVEGIYEVSGSVTKNAVIWISVTMILLILGLFFASWIRYKLVTAVCLTIAVLHTIIFSAALLIITRLPFTIVSFTVLAAVALLVLFAFVLTFEKVIENKKLIHNKDLTSEQLIALSKKETLKPLIFLVSGVALIAAVYMFVPSLNVLFAAITMFVCFLTGIYSYWFLGISLYDFMLGIKEAADKRHLSTNNSPAPKKK